MYLDSEERVKEDDKVLVVVTNQYMFEQLIWYHSKYPEGIWEALIIKFGVGNNSLMDIMYQKCVDSGIFSKIVVYGNQVSEQLFYKKIGIVIKYAFQYFMGTREKNDRRIIKSIMGHCDYKKVIVHSTVSSSTSVIALNALSDEVLVCLEDGLGDYLPVRKARFCTEIVNSLLAKMNIVNSTNGGHAFQLKYDNHLIKYCSLPDKMQYKNYKSIKQLFDGGSYKVHFTESEMLLKKENYEVIVFSAPFADFGNYEKMYYNVLLNWLKRNYGGKKILFKPHPRENCDFCLDGLNLDIGGMELAGERLLELMPDVEIVFTYTTTILLKACRENRDFKILCFDDVKSKQYHRALKNDSNVLGIKKDDWIIVGDRKDE